MDQAGFFVGFAIWHAQITYLALPLYFQLLSYLFSVDNDLKRCLFWKVSHPLMPIGFKFKSEMVPELIRIIYVLIKSILAGMWGNFSY